LHFVLENCAQGKGLQVDSELQQFIKSFPNEAQLRETLIKLFTRIPGITGIQHTHGTQEYGKDIIFYARDAIGDLILYACVVKNDKITGAADGQTSGRNVLIQVEQAFDTPHINPSGGEENVGHVYVVSPYECPQTTMRAIKGKLQPRSGQVTFLCGRLLFEKFAKYWGEYLAFETTILGSYLARLQRNFQEADPIAFLMNQHQIISSGSKDLVKVYVRQRFRKILQQFELMPGITVYPGMLPDILEEDVAALARNLTSIAGLLRNPEAWDPSQVVNAEPTAAELVSVAEALRASWNAEYERVRSDLVRLRKQVQPKHLTRVSLRTDMGNMGSLFGRVNNALSHIKTRLDAANAFAKECTNILTELGSSAHLRYCATNQMIQLAPLVFRGDSTAHELFLPEDLLNRIDHSLLVTAPAGYGKTSFCKWNFLNDVQMLSTSKSDIVPVYVPLHQLATVSVTSIDDLFIRSEDIKQLVQSAQDKGRRIRFYLDGLDEVSTPGQQQKLMELASTLPSKMPSAQVIVTARDYVTGAWLTWLPKVSLAELTEEQVKTFITNWLGDDQQEVGRFQKELQNSRTLLPLMNVPLLGTLIIAVFKRMQSLPDNKMKLYEIFVDLMCGGWDVAKNVRRDTRYGSNAKVAILTRLAGHLHVQSRREADEGDIAFVIEQAFPALSDSWRQVLSEILEDGLIVRLAAGLGFAHLSFQEYLAAKDLTTDPTGERQKMVLRRYLRGEDWYREVLAFYVTMGQRPDEIAEWINAVGLKISRDLRGQDLAKRWEFLMGCLQNSAPGWTPPLLHRRLRS
jgi:hypothetical protein